MSRAGVRVTILCEDQAHNSFAREFLERAGFHDREIRSKMCPPGSQAASDWVAKNFPQEIKAYRQQRNHQKVALVVVLDSDQRTVAERHAWLDGLCRAANVPPRQSADCVVYVIPRRNIETWFAYLRNNETSVDEHNQYSRYSEQRECRHDAGRLYEICQTGRLPRNAPESMVLACREYDRLRPNLHT